MLNLDKYKDEIKKIISDLKADDYTILLVPDEIINNDKVVEVINVHILHPATKKENHYLFRESPLKLKSFLDQCVRDFESKIFEELKNAKPINSL